MRLLGRIEPASGSGIFTGHSESREATEVRSESRRVESLAALSVTGGRRTGGTVSCAAPVELWAARKSSVAERMRRADDMLRLIAGVVDRIEPCPHSLHTQCVGKSLDDRARPRSPARHRRRPHSQDALLGADARLRDREVDRATK